MSFEKIVFNRFSGTLFQVIQPEAETLSWELSSAGLIGTDIRNKASESATKHTEKATLLLQGVEMAITSNPENFHKFSKILRCHPVLQEIGQGLEKELSLARQDSAHAQTDGRHTSLVVDNRSHSVKIPRSERVLGSGFEASRRGESETDLAQNVEKMTLQNTLENTTSRDVTQNAKRTALETEQMPRFISAPEVTITEASPITDATRNLSSCSLRRGNSTDSSTSISSCEEEAREIRKVMDDLNHQALELFRTETQLNERMNTLERKRKRKEKREEKQRAKLHRTTQQKLKETEEDKHQVEEELLEELQHKEEQIENEKKSKLDLQEKVSLQLSYIGRLQQSLHSTEERYRVLEAEYKNMKEAIDNPDLVSQFLKTKHTLEEIQKEYAKSQKGIEELNIVIAMQQERIDAFLQEDPESESEL